MDNLFSVIISGVLIIISSVLIKYIELSTDYKSAKNELDRLKLENDLLKLEIKTLRRDRVVFDPKTNLGTNISEVDEDIKEAVKYARDKSHPDNGGLDSDFIKFHKLYQRICK